MNPQVSSFMGIGTHFYGKDCFNKQDQSYITTLWYIFLFIPIFPIQSYRVIKNKPNYSPSVVLPSITNNYTILSELSFLPKQIIKIYLSGLFLVVLLFFWFYFLFTI